MAVTNKRLALATLSATPTAVYTVPALTKTTVTGLTICNTGATPRTVTVIYGSIGGSGGKHLLNYLLDAGETFGISIGEVLNTTEEILASQNAGADVDLIASGVEET